MNHFFLIYKKTILTLTIICLSILSIHGQDNKSEFLSHIRYGGGFGLNISNGFFSITVAPSAIYEFDKNRSLGIGLNATFNNQKNVSKSTILGGSLISLYNPTQNIQLSAEFEQLNVNRRYNVNLNIPTDNFWIPALYFGAGYRNGNVTFGIRYDVLFDDERSIYADPWAPFVRFYF